MRDTLSLPTAKQKEYGIGVIYVDIQQANTILHIQKINPKSLSSSNNNKLKFINKEIRLDLSGKTELVSINLPEGIYQITRVDVPHFDLPYRISTDNSEKWRFRIQEQNINYLGTLKVSPIRTKDTIDTLWLNQFAKNFADLNQHAAKSGILWPINNGIGYRDPFQLHLSTLELRSRPEVRQDLP